MAWRNPEKTCRLLRFDLRLAGWMAAPASILVVGAFLVFFTLVDAEAIYRTRVIEVILPLAFGYHAAFLFAPESEPALELLLSYPQPLTHLLARRVSLISLLHGGMALAAILFVTAAWQAEPLGEAILRWLAPAVVLGGIALFTTQLTRQSAFGALATTFLWASSLYGGDALLAAWRWAWPAHIYLQPGNTTPALYLLNRVILVGAGLVLAGAGVLLLSDDERTLGRK